MRFLGFFELNLQMTVNLVLNGNSILMSDRFNYFIIFSDTFFLTITVVTPLLYEFLFQMEKCHFSL